VTSVTINIGLNPATNKWHAEMEHPDGTKLYTEGFSSLEDCRKVVNDFLRDNGVEPAWREARS